MGHLLLQDKLMDQQKKIFPVTCLVKRELIDEWKPLHQLPSLLNKGFLKFYPDLHETPPLIIAEPEGRTEVSKRIESEEVRIDDISRLRELLALRDEVFRDNHINFQWDHEKSI